ncbi:carbon-nitrogen hydrolase family protein [Legionella israelensis]|uniref:carbon-nitrogen hydrolase family protein n=1 Tax=Legionella israelensis TaxID=454 RepID=UPI00117C97F9|nr:carbon-nitrogen hydrolase family protein [Legionella israelensis]QDP73080.1 carbon-nitrogen hydrolase family protein [Legionella israelensis]
MARIAIAQMTSLPRVEDNMTLVEQLIVQAHEQGAELIVLPENFALMGKKETDKSDIAEVFGHGPIQDKISQLAKQFTIWVIAGTLPIKGEGRRVRASSLVYDQSGHCVARYDKIHLFDVRVSEHEAHKESSSIEPGNNVVVVDTPVGKIGLSVCYDLRFPELYQQLVLKGAELFTIPSAFTATTGLAHWEVLLKARAIENLSYVVAPNQSGEHENGRQTYGHSMIIDPWGRTLAELETEMGVLSADIDLNWLHKLRKQFPCNDHHVLSR